MKKNYMKPSIVFDSFELAENIASCSIISSRHEKYVCAVEVPDWPGVSVFSDSSVCTFLDPEGSNMCYEIPLDGANVFTS